ncbi:hypothetical protein BN970_06130 [Mycolicibacterium conceptionense]|uniref:Uncharacterized protein n=1 Tax=Mycolicibacterium conceptionense TaxID=451644 RepID=A0A0U1DWF6_9MYCO|nr:hypothetical protein BN970_06130 [Mycolicibacterium conceptionense]
MLITPAGKSVCSAMIWRRRGRPRRVGRRLEDQGVARRQGRADLGQVDLVREVPRGDGADHADRLAGDLAVGWDALRGGVAEIGCPLVVLGGVGREGQIVDRAFQLGARSEHAGGADLGDRQFPQFLDIFAQRIAQLAQAVHPQRVVRRPVGVVERPTGRLDGIAHVLGVRVGRNAEHLLGGGVDGLEYAATAGDELAVDKQLTLAIGQYRHR